MPHESSESPLSTKNGAAGRPLKPLGIEIRAGLHTGEGQVMGDDVGSACLCKRGSRVEHGQGTRSFSRKRFDVGPLPSVTWHRETVLPVGPLQHHARNQRKIRPDRPPAERPGSGPVNAVAHSEASRGVSDMGRCFFDNISVEIGRCAASLRRLPCIFPVNAEKLQRLVRPRLQAQPTTRPEIAFPASPSDDCVIPAGWRARLQTESAPAVHRRINPGLLRSTLRRLSGRLNILHDGFAARLSLGAWSRSDMP